MTKFVVEGADAEGTAVSRNVPVLLGGVDTNGNVQTLLVGTDGSLSTGTVTISGPISSAQSGAGASPNSASIRKGRFAFFESPGTACTRACG